MLEPFLVQPCADRADCTELRPDWDTWLIDLRVDGGTDVGSRGAFWFLRTAPVTYWERWLVADDGTARLGLRSLLRTGDCRHSAFHADESRFAVVTLVPDREGYLDSLLYAGSWGDGGATMREFGLVSGVLPRSSDFHSVRVGPARIGLESAPWHAVLDVPWEGEPALVGTPGDGGETILAASIDGSVFYDVYGFPHHVRVATDGAPGRVLLAPPDAEAIRFVTDGTDMAWIQPYGRVWDHEFERLELWASPHTARPEEVVPRRIGDVAGTNPYPEMTIGAGYVAIREWEPTEEITLVRVFRLADGARATIRPPEGRTLWRAAAYITREEIAVAVSLGGSPPEDEALLRIRIDALDFNGP